MGEGSVYQRKDGRWVAEFVDNHGRRRYRYRKTRAAARQALRGALRARDEGVTGDDPTLEAWTVWWLDQLDLRPTTVADYRYKIRLLPRWLTRRRLSDLTPMDVHEALRELAAGTNQHGNPRAPSTVAQVRTVLANCLRDAERYGHVTRNVATLAAPIPMASKEVVPLTVEEAAALLAVVKGHRLESLYRVALSLGLRQGECLGLRWDDVDLEAGRLEVRRQITRTNQGVRVEGDVKTARSRRSLLLPQVCVRALTVHRRELAAEQLAASRWYNRGLVWPSRVGSPLSGRNLLRHLHGACEDAGIRRVSFHTLRHSAATLLLAQGVPESTIMDVLGHTDTRMLARYAHVTDSLRQSAADAIDRAFE